MEKNDFLKRAIEKARESVEQGGFPAGAIVVKDGKIIGEGISIGNKLHDPTSHGEMAAIRDACKNLETSDLSGATLYSSMQPCVMCLSAAMWSSISEIMYACAKEKVSPLYYGGNYDPASINESFLRPLRLTHASNFEDVSLEIVTAWEKNLTK